MLSQLRSGALEMFVLSGTNVLSTMARQTSLYGVGFAFKDYSQVWAALDGDLGAFLRGVIAKVNLHAFDKLWDIGFRQITSSTKPILTPEDLQGFKIRVPVSPLWTSLFQHLGAAPTSINFSEVYSALQTHIVDGQENPLSLILIAKLYEVQKHISITNHMWDGQFTLVNSRVWKVAASRSAGSAGAQLQCRGDEGARRPGEGEPERRERADQAGPGVPPHRYAGVPRGGVQVRLLQEVEGHVRRGSVGVAREVLGTAGVSRGAEA